MNNTPKVFISYSWSSVEHENRVIEWAERLVNDGVDVILDKWELKEGQDKYAFMERMVTDNNVSKVLILSDAKYTEKANYKKGGVGTESQIISKEIYEKVNQEKFIPIVLEYIQGEEPCLPVFLSSRIYLDFSTPENYFKNYEKLLRIIFNKPLHVKPKIGQPPENIFKESKPISKSKIRLEMFKESIVNDNSNYRGLSLDYLESYLENLKDYRIIDESSKPYFDEIVYQNIQDLLPIRNEFIDFFTSVRLKVLI